MPRPSFPLSFGVIGLALLAMGTPQLLDAGRSADAPWKEVDAGKVPNEFGDLLCVTGSAGNQVCVFVDPDDRIRIVDFGNKVSGSCTLIQRCPTPRKPGKQWKDPATGWTETLAGVIPHRFGDLLDVDGQERRYRLSFRDGEGSIRIVEFQGTIQRQCVLVRRTYDGDGARPR